MKKRTLVGKLQEKLQDEVRARDLRVVAAGKISIVGTGKHVTAISGDKAC
jgi:hypothetical protein